MSKQKLLFTFAVNCFLLFVATSIATWHSASQIQAQGATPTPTPNVRIYFDLNYLVIYIEAPDVYLNGLIIQTDVGQRISVMDHDDFSVFSDGAVPQGYCLVLHDINIQPPDLGCYMFKAKISPFWRNGNTIRNVEIYSGQDRITVCSNAYPDCAFYYSPPVPTFTPTASPTETPSPTSTPTLTPTSTQTQLPFDTPAPLPGITLTPVPTITPRGLPMPQQTVSRVNEIAWSPDGNHILTAHDNGDLCLRRWMNGTLDLVPQLDRECLQAHNGAPVVSVSWSPSSDQFATIGNGTMKIWTVDPITGVITSIEEPISVSNHAMVAVEWNVNGQYVATGSINDNIYIWDTGSWEADGYINTAYAQHITWNPDATHLATLGDNGTIRLINTRTESVVTLGSSGYAGVGIDWSATGLAVLAKNAQNQGTLRLYTPNNLRPVLASEVNPPHIRLAQNLPEPSDVEFNGDGRCVAVAVRGGVYVLQAYAPYELVGFYQSSGNRVIVTIDWNDQSGVLIGADDNGVLNFWQPDCNQPQRMISSGSWKAIDSGINAFDWNRSGKYMAVIDQNTLSIWDTDGDLEQIIFSDIPSDSLQTMDWNDSISSLIVAGGCDPSFSLLDVFNPAPSMTPNPRRTVGSADGLRACIDTAAFSPSGRYLAIGDRASLVYIWDDPQNSSQYLHQLSDLNGAVNEVEWNRSSNLLAAVGQNGRLVIWEVTENSAHHRSEAQPDPWASMNALAWSPTDDNLIATGGSDCNNVDLNDLGCVIAIWNITQVPNQGYDGAYLLFGHTAPIIDVSWSSTGNLLASLDENGQIIIWNVRYGIRLASIQVPEATQIRWHPDTRVEVLGIGDRQGVIHLYQFS